MRRVRLVIADRRPIVLQGFASMFAAERDFEIVASCLDGISCLEAIRIFTPDVVLVEDGFSDVTASELLAVADAEKLSTRLVFFTASVARGDLAEAIAEGACSAISMRAKPETLLKSLRLVAGGASFQPEPRPDQAPAGNEENGEVGENVLAVLTDQEPKLCAWSPTACRTKRLRASLTSAERTIKVHLDRIFQKLGSIIGRNSRRSPYHYPDFGGFGALAALIFAALDDVHAADLNAVNAGHAVTDTFTVMVEDGTAEVATIIVNVPKKWVGASGTAARAVIKARRVYNAAKGTSISAGKLVNSSVDITGSTVTLAALSPARPTRVVLRRFLDGGGWNLDLRARNSYGAAHGFDLDDSLTDVSTLADCKRHQGIGDRQHPWQRQYRPGRFRRPRLDIVGKIRSGSRLRDSRRRDNRHRRR